MNLRIKKFRAKAVHGCLDFDIKFDDDLTFLIGINGSGKTSVLKLLLGLITPSYNYLNEIEYNFCNLTCSEGQNLFLIQSEQNPEKSKFRISFRKNEESVEKSNVFTRIDDNFDATENDDFRSQDGWRSVFESDQVIKKIKDLTTPKFLGLDRRMLDSIPKQVGAKYIRKSIDDVIRNKFKQRKHSNIDAGLSQIEGLVHDYFRNVAKRQPQISGEFKDKIFRQSFNFNSSSGQIDNTLSVTPLDLEKRYNRVLDAIERLGLENLNDDVNKYFEKMSELSAKIKSSDGVEKDSKYYSYIYDWLYNYPQIKRIDEIIEFSKEYQYEVDKLLTPIKNIEKIVTKFLKEGNKFLKIESDGDIRVNYESGSRSSEIYKLSSGEKQIIIMIANLIFAEDSGKAGIFIIDEPELSLHIAWQEIFVESILQASPHTQFILATHSPSIIAKTEWEIKCQDISNSYNDSYNAELK